MSSSPNVEIRITAQDLASPAFQQVTGQLKGLGTTATAVSAETRAAGTAAKEAGGGFSLMGGNILKTAGEISIAGFAAKEVVGKMLEMAKAAAEDEASVARLRTAINNTAGGWQEYGSRVDEAVAHGRELAYSVEETRGALSTLVAITGDTGTALARLTTAQDFARGSGMDLATTSRLLGKVTDESITVLQRYGIRVDKNATSQDLLNKVDEKFKGQAAAYAESSAGKLAIFDDNVKELEKSLGTLLLPRVIALTDALNHLPENKNVKITLEIIKQMGVDVNTPEAGQQAKDAASVTDLSTWPAAVDHVLTQTSTAANQLGKAIHEELVFAITPGADGEKAQRAWGDFFSFMRTGISSQQQDAIDLAATQARVRGEEMKQNQVAQSQQAMITASNIALAQQHADALRKVDDATQHFTGTSLEDVKAQQLLAAQMHETDAVIAASGQSTFAAAVAMGQLQRAQEGLAGAYQQGLAVQSTYNSQASEYAGEADNVQKALDIWKQRLDDGKISQDEYNKHLADGTEAMTRYKGGQEDAILTAGDYAIANEKLMSAQDAIHAQYPDLIAGSEAYNQKLKDAFIAAGGTEQAFNDMQAAGGGLNGVIAGPGGLTEAVLALIQALKDADLHPKPTVDLKITGAEALDAIYTQLNALNGHTYTANFIGDIGFTGAGGLPVPGGGGGTIDNGGNVGAPPDNSGRGPQRTAQSYTPKDPLPPLIPAPSDSMVSGSDVTGATVGASNAAAYAAEIKAMVQSLADAAAEMGDGVDVAKKYADLAKSTLDVFSSAVQFTKDMGDKVFEYGDWQAHNVEVLKQITEKAVTSLADAAALVSGDQLDATKKYADAAQASLGVMSAAVGFVKDMGDLVVEYGGWQVKNEANLKFIAEDAVSSIGDSAAMFSGPFLDDIKAYSDAANAALGTLTNALSFVKAMAAASDLGAVDLQHVGQEAATLAAVSLLAAQSFKAAAGTWDATANPSIKDLADAVSSSTGGLSAALGFLKSLSDVTTEFDVNSGNVLSDAYQLGHDARVIADAFALAAAGWGDKANPAMTALAANVGDATGALKNSLDLLKAFSDHATDATLRDRDIAREAQRLSLDARLIADSFLDASQMWGNEANTGMTALATNVGDATGALKNTLDLLKAFNDHATDTVLGSRAIARTAQTLSLEAREIADAFRTQAATWTTDVTPAMTDLNTAVGASAGALSTTLDLLAKFDTFKPPTAAKISMIASALAADAVLFVKDLQAASAGMNGDAVKAAGEWADGAGKVVSLMGNTADTMTKIATVSKISKKQSEIFSDNMHVVFDLVRQLNIDAQPYITDAASFKDVIELIASDMNAAAAAIQTLAPGGNAASGLAQHSGAVGGGGGGGPSTRRPLVATPGVSGGGGGELIAVYLDSQPIAHRVEHRLMASLPTPIVRGG